MKKQQIDVGGNQVSVMVGDSNSTPYKKTLGAAQDVFAADLTEDEIVEFWADQNFHARFPNDSSDAVATDYQFKAGMVYTRLIKKGCNMSILQDGSSGGTFYLTT